MLFGHIFNSIPDDITVVLQKGDITNRFNDKYDIPHSFDKGKIVAYIKKDNVISIEFAQDSDVQMKVLEIPSFMRN